MSIEKSPLPPELEGQMEDYRQKLMRLYQKGGRPQPVQTPAPGSQETPSDGTDFAAEPLTLTELEPEVVSQVPPVETPVRPGMPASEEEVSPEKTLQEEALRQEPEGDWDADLMQQYQEAYPKEGRLNFRGTTARGVLPIQNAQITVSKTIDGKTQIFARLTTDVDGLTPTISLPAPDKELSLHPTPDGVRPYATYDVLAEKTDYVTVLSKDVPVFEGVESQQQVDFTPLAAQSNRSEITVVESEPNL